MQNSANRESDHEWRDLMERGPDAPLDLRPATRKDFQSDDDAAAGYSADSAARQCGVGANQMGGSASMHTGYIHHTGDHHPDALSDWTVYGYDNTQPNGNQMPYDTPGYLQTSPTQSDISTLSLRYAIPSEKTITSFNNSTYFLAPQGEEAVKEAWEEARSATQQGGQEGDQVPVCFSLGSPTAWTLQHPRFRPVALSQGAWEQFKRRLDSLTRDGLIRPGGESEGAEAGSSRT